VAGSFSSVNQQDPVVSRSPRGTNRSVTIPEGLLLVPHAANGEYCRDPVFIWMISTSGNTANLPLYEADCYVCLLVPDIIAHGSDAAI
jgi:hypothetical protein